MATSGFRPYVDVMAPRVPISSCTVAATMKSPGARPSFASVSSTRAAIHTPALSSKARETAMFLPKRSKPTPNVMTSPTMTSFFTRLAGRPRSMTSLSMGVTLLRSSGSMRWMGLRPTTPRSGS